MVYNFLVLVAYLGIVYVPFALCIGIVWLMGASIFRKTTGATWQTAMKRSAKEAAITTIVILTGLLFLGLVAFLSGV